MTPAQAFRLSAVGLFATLAAPVSAAAEVPAIGQVEYITEGLIDTAIAYEIGRVCDSLEGRRLQGLAFLWSLEGHARRLGFSNEEIQAYIRNREEKARLEGIARARLRAMGAVEGQAETYCAVGRAEMEKGSRIGGLLAPA
ncbi:DUF5333 domain-containing protein [Rubellimicrobium sp. CFH 75288]|uniref:DUF5333 domain-containing protein n=1 Tax=Rubellimicrobium sp. CFH 75288 TaxID=2697034 RepID=UPI001412C45A|nr:DUF5333 domain-containing protein [Rubellimicrobium sp. CFH 75288]NAZ35807.1 hypothetical protein [Rubellimicrobium sp. CFH 75288]